MNINVKFHIDHAPKTFMVTETTTVSELVESIYKLSEMQNQLIYKIIFKENNLISDSLLHKTVRELSINSDSIYVTRIQKLTPEGWVKFALNSSNVSSLMALKPVATPDSGQSPRILSGNWRLFSTEDQQEILAKLSKGKKDLVKVYLNEDIIIFYLENHLDLLLKSAKKNVQEVLELISLPAEACNEELFQKVFGHSEAEMMSLIYIMFGDLFGLSPVKHAESELTSEGKKVFYHYLQALLNKGELNREMINHITHILDRAKIKSRVIHFLYLAICLAVCLVSLKTDLRMRCVAILKQMMGHFTLSLRKSS